MGCSGFFEQNRTLMTLWLSVKPSTLQAKSHHSHSTLLTYRECELLHQHFIRRLNKEKQSYKVRPLCLHCHFESASKRGVYYDVSSMRIVCESGVNDFYRHFFTFLRGGGGHSTDCWTIKVTTSYNFKLKKYLSQGRVNGMVVTLFCISLWLPSTQSFSQYIDNFGPHKWV